jgi:transcriptional regulator with XRE-family HTH domain
MDRARVEIPELRDLGGNIATARRARRMSQAELAARCSLTQGTISSIETGNGRPSLDHFFRIARALEVPLQRLISGSDRPGADPAEIAVQLRDMGVADLWVREAPIPGAFRRPEEVIASAVRGAAPDPRILSALPAVLAWNEWDRVLLKAFARRAGARRRAVYRLAWLADIALAIDRRRGFPGGCRRDQLEEFLRSVPRPRGPDWDGLGRPMAEEPKSPLWRRWRNNFDATLDEFEQRAVHLAEIKEASRRRRPRRGRRAGDAS